MRYHACTYKGDRNAFPSLRAANSFRSGYMAPRVIVKIRGEFYVMPRNTAVRNNYSIVG